MNVFDRAPVASPAAPARPVRGNLLVAALAAACIGGAAVAADAPPAIRVPYGDLNLSSDAGREALLHRLASAARRLCDEPGTLELQLVPYFIHPICPDNRTGDITSFSALPV